MNNLPKIYLLKNSEGKIVSAFERPKLGETPSGPETPKGYVVEVVDGPDDYIKDQSFYKKH